VPAVGDHTGRRAVGNQALEDVGVGWWEDDVLLAPEEPTRKGQGPQSHLHPFHVIPVEISRLKRDVAWEGQYADPAECGRKGETVAVEYRSFLQLLPVADHAEIEPSLYQGVSPKKKMGPDKWSVEHPPRHDRDVELRWLWPGPGVHDQHPCNVSRVFQGVAQADRSAPVLHDENDPVQSEPVDELGHCQDMVLEGMPTLVRRRVREPESEVIRGHGPTSVADTWDDLPVEEGPGRVAMEEDNYGPAFYGTLFHVMHPIALDLHPTAPKWIDLPDLRRKLDHILPSFSQNPKVFKNYTRLGG
jgi:hypothetical protein